MHETPTTKEVPTMSEGSKIYGNADKHWKQS
jgi:hypothetical protein